MTTTQLDNKPLPAQQEVVKSKKEERLTPESYNGWNWEDDNPAYWEERKEMPDQL